MNLMGVGEFNGRRLYAGLRLDYRLKLRDPTSTSRAISAVAELFVVVVIIITTTTINIIITYCETLAVIINKTSTYR